jgi:hypothetical protein
VLLRMHRGKPDFDPLKFTPNRIANKKDINIIELIEYFENHTLDECGDKFGCSKITIKRRLKAAGIDTSRHNHSYLATQKYKDSVKLKPSDHLVIGHYIKENLDTKTIAELYGLHYNTIRSIVRRLGIKKSQSMVSKSMMSRHLAKHGVNHPAQRPDVLKKTSISLNKAAYKEHEFKSITELGYALYLDKNGIEWYYEEMRCPYVDMLNGNRRIYVIDFTIIIGEEAHWVEVKPNNDMIPDDKRIYASRRAEEAGVVYRGLNDDERAGLWECVTDGYNFKEVEFKYRKPRSDTNKITYYFKSEDDAIKYNLEGWKQLTKPTNEGALWKKILIRK